MIDYVKPRKDYKNVGIRDYVYKVKEGKYEIKKGKHYYGRYSSRDDAREVCLELKKLGWDKENLQRAQSNAKVKPLDRYSRNTSGYAHVIKQLDNRLKQGYVWAYSYKENGKVKRLTCKTIKGLEEKVKEKGLEWKKL